MDNQKKCILYGDCTYNTPSCEEDEPHFKCKHRVTKGQEGEDMKDIWDIIARLNEIARIEGTELGESLYALTNLYNCNSELSDEFRTSLEKEIYRIGEWVDKSVRIVKMEEKVVNTWYEIEIVEE